jgi:2',3'-cyclic-nucleotide 2'-phosphodiesterase (5'-nucleotidase family)
MIALLLLACVRTPAPTLATSSLAVPADPMLRVELVEKGTVAERLSGTPADLVLLYAGEHKGSMQTCGCPKRPRGSLSRLDAMADAIRAQGAPTLLVNGGHWLEETLDGNGAQRSDTALGHRLLAQALPGMGWDALNVAPVDASALGDLDPAARAALPLVSANVRAEGVRPWVQVERGGLRVGITGIAAPGGTLREVAVDDPVTAAGPVIEELARGSDVVVLLVHGADEAARTLAKAHPALDVVIHTGLHRDLLAPARAGEAVWAFSHYQTMRLGELRLDLGPAKVRKGAPAGMRVEGALDRKIDLDATLAGDPALEAAQAAARAAVDAEQQTLFGAP